VRLLLRGATGNPPPAPGPHPTACSFQEVGSLGPPHQAQSGHQRRLAARRQDARDWRRAGLLRSRPRDFQFLKAGAGIAAVLAAWALLSLCHRLRLPSQSAMRASTSKLRSGTIRARPTIVPRGRSNARSRRRRPGASPLRIESFRWWIVVRSRRASRAGVFFVGAVLVVVFMVLRRAAAQGKRPEPPVPPVSGGQS
jgi:hypothetical protein